LLFTHYNWHLLFIIWIFDLILEFILYKAQKFLDSFSDLRWILLAFGVLLKSFENFADEITLAKFISKEIHRELIELIIKDRDEIHHQPFVILLALDTQVCWLWTNK
jgi:hypothetical protein